MKLRAIETVGFKSFADKLELAFVDGITAIVGPNGSGKSNVSDAIRWVMGEQSLRALRGSSMEDVIFSGSGKRRALNLAEVTLFFTNQDGALPVDFQEVSVCRRVFRSGDSAYFINKTPCLLKDIHDLFADTGLGRGSLAFIGQNRIEEILNSRPEDRRALFEETAGITRYKRRKRDAMRRLEETDANITRLNDIRFELAGRLEPLRESAEKTKQYNLVFNQHREYSITLRTRKIDRARQTRQTAHDQINQLREEEAGLLAAGNLNENKIFLLVGQLEKAAGKSQEIQQNSAQIQADIEKLSGRKAVLSERIKQNQERCAAIEEDRTRLSDQTDKLTRELADLTGRLGAQRKKEQDARRDKEKAGRQLADTERFIRENEQAQQTEQTEILERKRRILQLSNDLRALDNTLSLNARRKEKLNNERTGLSERVALLDSELAAHNKRLNEYKAQKQELLASKKSETAKLGEAEKELAVLANQDKQAEKEAFALSARVSVLEKLQAEYDGFSFGVKRLLNNKSVWRDKLIGTLGELIKTEAAYVLAVETALGAAVQNIVTEDDQTAKQAIEFLKKEKAGRATFLPLSNLRLTPPNEKECELAALPGIIGFAGRFIECEPRVRPAVEFLLGRTLLANDMNAALSVGRSGVARLRAVTLDGDVVYAGGTISGGSRSGKESGFLSRGQEISSNRAKLSELEAQRLNLREAIERTRQTLSGVQSALKAIDAKTNSLDMEMVKTTAYSSDAEKNKKQLVMGVNAVAFEQEELSREIKEAALAMTNLAAEKAAAEAADTDKQDLSAQLKEKMAELQTARDTANTSHNDAQLRHETARQATELLTEQYDDVQARLTQLQKEEKRLDGELKSFRNNINEAGAERQNTDKQILERGQKMEETQKALEAAVAEQMRLLPEQNELEKTGREIKNNLSAVQSRLRNAEGIFVRYDTELNIALEELKTDYGLTVEETQQFSHIKLPENRLVELLTELESRLTEIGPVNPAAVSEYEEVKGRHDFMSAQYEDLVKAKEDLTLLIKDIDNTMSRRFKEAFNAINGFFQTCFDRLFGGGTAGLKLTEPLNVLDAGIEIIVQPPGKKLQMLSLLSGGERALTIIALLFAMLTYRPAPFCVLDEIDAALDDVNAERFIGFLTDYARKTQFVMITHRKTTMQAAHLLHGVTMEDSGVSKLISVKLLDKNKETA